MDFNKSWKINELPNKTDIPLELNTLNSLISPNSPFAKPKLGDQALCGIVGKIIQKVEPHTEADNAALLLQFLAGFGSLVGRSPRFRTDGAYHHLNLNAAIVGSSSKARKGTSWGVVYQILKDLDPDWANGCVKSGLTSGEALIWVVRDPSVEGDSSDEGIKDKRLMIQESEFAQILKKMKGAEAVLSAIIRNAWDGNNLQTLSKGKPAKATNPHISIVAHITQEELESLMGASDYSNGFANRFLWAYVIRSKKLPHGGNYDETLLEEEIQQLRKIVTHARKTTEMKRSAEANRLWESIYDELSEERSGLYGSVTSRAEAQVLRLSMIYALLDESSIIEVQHLKSAKTLWDYCDQSAAYLFKNQFESKLTNKLYAELKKSPQGLTRTQISVEIFRGKKLSLEISKAVEELRSRGLIEIKKISTEGREAEKVVVIR